MGATTDGTTPRQLDPLEQRMYEECTVQERTHVVLRIGHQQFRIYGSDGGVDSPDDHLGALTAAEVHDWWRRMLAMALARLVRAHGGTG